VVTQNVDPAAPVDFTSSLVVGSADTYAGGQSAATGTRVRVAADPPIAATTAVAAPRSATDSTRHARLAQGGSWGCPFPPEADGAGLDEAYVMLRITLTATGSVREVAVVKDPGHGFGREARICAVAKRYDPALDATGAPVAGTLLVNVHFER
jgi:protein TonB